MEIRREEVRLHFLCQVSSIAKLPTFQETIALQRKLTFGALDFSPLRHSSAFTKHKNYTTIRSEWHSEILENLSRGESAATQSKNLSLN